MAALSRIARGEHRTFQMRSTDTVILSSSLIPGNEHAVFGVINRMRRAGIRVIDNRNANVHVSGHAASGELLFLYNAVRPSNVMPVHGEWRHLRANAELAEQTGVAHDAVVVTENGVTVDLIDGRATISGRVEVGRAYVDGVSTGDIEQPTLADRIVLGEGGFISIAVAIDATTGRAVAAPTLSGRGFSEDPKALRGVLPLVEAELARTESDGIVDTQRVAQQVRRVVGKWVGETYRRRPMIVPTVIAV
jgi:ribonuclease J